MRRQTASLYNYIANIHHERNDTLHGLELCMKADTCRTEFMDDVVDWEWEGDADHCVLRYTDILAMAATDANMVMTQIANGESTALFDSHNHPSSFQTDLW
jgi:hypothetical protein